MLTGNQILNYKITRKIGSGGMAEVYEAIHTKLDTKVAIKVLDPVLAANESIRQRFMQEAKIMASLDHEGITRVIDFDDNDNQLAIIMEYLDGQTLAEYVVDKGVLNEDQAKNILIPILDAFQFAHDENIVHRDVKPSNIFITKKGKIKIMDFGIAKMVEDGAKVLTQTGTQMGTPVYMSPEQVKDSKHIDHRTDIYSLGVTLWFMLAGKPPYDTSKDSSYDIFTKIVNNPLTELNTEINVNGLIAKATSKDINGRFSSCQEFINAWSQNDDATKISIPIPIDSTTINESKKVAEDIKVEIKEKLDFRKFPDEFDLELLYKYPDLETIFISGQIKENIKNDSTLLEPIRDLSRLREINISGQPLSTAIPLAEYFGTYDDLFEHILKMIESV